MMTTLNYNYQKLHFSSFKIHNCAVSVKLVDATMQRHAVVACFHEIFQQNISVLLFIHKHNGAAHILVQSKELEQLEEFLFVLQNHDILLHLFADNTSATNLHLDRLCEDASGKSLHLPRECCRKHDSLPVWSDVVHNSHDLRLKAHVKHSICFIQNDVSDPTQICDSTCRTNILSLSYLNIEVFFTIISS
jgi:hypothetical protein